MVVSLIGHQEWSQRRRSFRARSTFTAVSLTKIGGGLPFDDDRRRKLDFKRNLRTFELHLSSWHDHRHHHQPQQEQDAIREKTHSNDKQTHRKTQT